MKITFFFACLLSLLFFNAIPVFAQNDSTELHLQSLKIKEDINSTTLSLNAHQYLGNISHIIDNGLGARLNFDVLRKNEGGMGAFIGINMDKQKAYFTDEDKNGKPAMTNGFVGLSYIASLYQSRRADMSLQADISHNFGGDYFRAAGFGVMLNYTIHSKPFNTSGHLGNESQEIAANCLNFHAGIKGLISNNPEANGAMFEAGFAYRFAIYMGKSLPVKRYKEFKSIKIENEISLMISPVMGTYLDGLSSYYSNAYGGIFAAVFNIKPKLNAGIELNVLQSNLKQELPETFALKPSAITQTFGGATIGYYFDTNSPNDLLVQAGVYISTHRANGKLKASDSLFVSKEGVAIGGRLNYAINIRENIYANDHKIDRKMLNLYLGGHYFFLNEKTPYNGLMLSVGVGYKLSMGEVNKKEAIE